MTTPAKITDHFEKARALLLGQFKGKVRIENLLASLIDPTQLTTDLGMLTQAGAVRVNTAIDATTYTATVNGFDYSYEATVPGDTIITIATAIAALIGAGTPQAVPVTVTDNLDGSFLIKTSDGTNFALAVTPTIMQYTETDAAAVKALQELEDVFYELMTVRFISNATGDQLDIIGKILGRRRLVSWSDVTYRAVLYGIVWHNISNGEPEAVIECALAITESDFVQYQEIYPGRIKLTWDGEPELLDALINQLTDEAALGGVRVENIQAHPTKPFTLASGSSPEAESSTEGGWGNWPEDSTGGYLSRLVGG